MFFELSPTNNSIEDILIKVAALNDFYSTNIFSVFPVAKHIQNLDIDEKLIIGDVTLVDDVQNITINGKRKNFYSFATKYCSHHKPLDYPIYDSYVDKILWHFRCKDNFFVFERSDLKDFKKFKNILIEFRASYDLEMYSLKDIDKYLWQLGKEYYPNRYGKVKK